MIKNIFLIVLITSFLTGCAVFSNPVTSMQSRKTIVDKNLLGTWEEISKDKEEGDLLKIRVHRGKELSILTYDHEKKEKYYYGHISQIGSGHYLNVKAEGYYLIVKYWFKDSRHMYFDVLPVSEELEKSVRKGEIKGFIKSKEEIFITDSSSNVESYLNKNNHIWSSSKPTLVRRKGNKRLVEQEEDRLTRQEISIMHKMGVRMALIGERPYIVPLNISPRKLVKTELLDFSGIQLNDLPQWIIHFKKIRKLDLSNTNISVRQTIILIGNGFGKNLEILDLSNGRMDDGETQGLNRLKNLRELNLANVSRFTHHHYWFRNTCIKSLLKLDMSGNDLDNGWLVPFSDLHIGCMPNIRVLNLSNTDIDLSELEADKFPVGLEVLDITKNNDNVLNGSFGNVFALPNLIKLKIDDNVKIPASLRKRLSRNR